jgi:hypothetical protein
MSKQLRVVGIGHLIPTIFILSLSAAVALAQTPTADDASITSAPVTGVAGDATAAASPDPTAQDAQAQVEELRSRLDILAAEVEKLRSGEPEPVELSDERRRALGLAPSAAATYRRGAQGVSLAGYGELLLENFASENESGAGNAPTTRLDVLRAILYAGYRFNDRFLFNSEIEVEHGNQIFVEFAYVDYLVNDNLSVRGGLLLVPLGLVNEFHEPNVFLGARRPETEQRIVPSTWRENGAGVLATFGAVSVRATLVNGLNASGFSSSGLRGGRQNGIQARAANLGAAGRVDVTPLPGIFAGLGFYTGGSGQNAIVVDGRALHVNNRIVEFHAQGQLRGLDLRALYARAAVDDAGALSAALGLPVSAPVAEQMDGGYLQAGYNLLSQRATVVAVTPFVRYEHVDTQKRVPAGYMRDLSKDGNFATLGLEIKPIPNVVVKTDYQWITNAAGTGRNQFNINLGYAF